MLSRVGFFLVVGVKGLMCVLKVIFVSYVFFQGVQFDEKNL